MFPVPKPFLKACFVVVEANRFALGGLNRQPSSRSPPDVDQRLAAKAAAARFNICVGHRCSTSSLEDKNSPSSPRLPRCPPYLVGAAQRHWFGPMSIGSKVTVCAVPVDADSADRDRQQPDKADEDEASVDVPRDRGHQERGDSDEDLKSIIANSASPRPGAMRFLRHRPI